MADGAAEKAGAEIVETKRHYMAKIMSWNLPDAKAKDIIFIVHAQLRRKQKRAQIIAVRPRCCARHAVLVAQRVVVADAALCAGRCKA